MLKNILLFALIALVLVVISYLSISALTSARDQKTVDLKGHKITLEIADSENEQRKGLSERDSLPKDKGMFFKFSQAATHTFWMKDMRFPIDIIFINGDKIVTIYENVQPETDKAENLSLYTPTEPANKVIELNAGLAKEFGLKTGDTINLPN